MKLFVLGLPHTKFTDDYLWCAYTQKARRFVEMMTGPDYEVVAIDGFGGSDSEHIPPFDAEHALWRKFNGKCLELLKEQGNPGDYICVTGGLPHQPVTSQLPHMTAVEYGVGYGGVYSNFRVFESYAWMHTVYGSSSSNAHAVDGRWYDAVIPNSYHSDEFSLGDGSGDYLLFLGRGIERKGLYIARMIAHRSGVEYEEYGSGTRGGVITDRLKRLELLQNARAVIMPTVYVEPFGGVHVEAMMCGTPVITTDWGVFTETVEDGFNGYRCRTLQEFVDAVDAVKSLSRHEIREHALSRWSTDVVRLQYDEYFTRLETLKHDGWYTLRGQS